jgi:hypothetical protein
MRRHPVLAGNCVLAEFVKADYSALRPSRKVTDFWSAVFAFGVAC